MNMFCQRWSCGAEEILPYNVNVNAMLVIPLMEKEGITKGFPVSLFVALLSHAESFSLPLLSILLSCLFGCVTAVRWDFRASPRLETERRQTDDEDSLPMGGGGCSAKDKFVYQFSGTRGEEHPEVDCIGME